MVLNVTVTVAVTVTVTVTVVLFQQSRINAIKFIVLNDNVLVKSVNGRKEFAMTPVEYDALKSSFKNGLSKLSSTEITEMLRADNLDPLLGDYSSVG